MNNHEYYFKREDKALIELEGNYFSPQYEIWFDDVPIQTTFIDEKRIQNKI